MNCFCWIPYQFGTKNSCSFLLMVSILNHPFVCILKYLQHLQKICQLFHRVFSFAINQQPCFSFNVHFFVRWCVFSFSIMMCYSCYNKNFCIVQVSKLCTLNGQGDLCFILSIHVTYYSIGIYKEHVELYNNPSHYHLVVGLLVVHLTWCHGGHCINVHGMKLLLLGMFRVESSLGFKVSSS